MSLNMSAIERDVKKVSVVYDVNKFVVYATCNMNDFVYEIILFTSPSINEVKEYINGITMVTTRNIHWIGTAMLKRLYYSS